MSDMHPDDLLALVLHMHRAADQSVEDVITAENRSFIRMWEPEPDHQEGSKRKLLTPTFLASLKRSLYGQA